MKRKKELSNVTKTIINNLYLEILIRPADKIGLDYYGSLLESGKTIQDIKKMISRSPEADSLSHEKKKELSNVTKTIINNLYLEILIRPADKIGLDYYGSLLESGKTIQDIKKMISLSIENGFFSPKISNFLKIDQPLPTSGFFDNYEQFVNANTKIQDTELNRLNIRYKGMIENNLDHIKNASILDIASNDGKWSFAAIKNGAKFVYGIEGRKYHVDTAKFNFEKYGIPKNQYLFQVGDIHEKILDLEPNQFDVIFCLGFFYHTTRQKFLLEQFKRLNPRYIILDTHISQFPSSEFQYRKESPESPTAAIGNSDKIIVSMPTKSMLESMLKDFGFNYEFFNYHDCNINNWLYLADYYKGGRVTLTIKCQR